jgi:ADP-heptose:LPS heptosyltransferase
VKPKLLVIELWGMGDLVIASPFLQAASEKYDVTLLAKPYAQDLQPRFWPSVKVVPFVAPWSAFEHKYNFFAWPWLQIFRLWKQLRAERFDYGVSAHWPGSVRRAGDPRDHLLLLLVRVKTRLGFPRFGSQYFLSKPLKAPEPTAHRYENWQVMGQALGLDLPRREKLGLPVAHSDGDILVHTGAGQPVRVWPLERYRNVVNRLRAKGFHIQVACDPDQERWWRGVGEQNLAVPRTVGALIALLEKAGAFVGNDSGPGHLASFCGVPTFTIFGPQLPEWFAPLHPASEWLDGKACPYKPCSDYCRFPVPYCMVNSQEEEVSARVEAFVTRVLSEPAAPRLIPH